MIARLLTLLALLLLPSLAQATIYYIDDAGDDAAAGTSTSTPWRTWARAFRTTPAPLATCGDTLIVMDGTYTTATHGNPLITGKACTAGNPLTVQWQNQRVALISGNGASWSFRIISSAYIVLDGARIKAVDNSGSSASVANLEIRNSNHVTVTHPLVYDNNRYGNTHLIGIFDSTNTLIEDFELYDFHRHGVLITNSGNPNDANNVLRRGYCHGRQAADIPGGYGPTGEPYTSDDCIAIYPSVGNIVENVIGENISTGFAAVGASYNRSNQFLGVVALGTRTSGTDTIFCIRLQTRGTGATFTVTDTVIRDAVCIDNGNATNGGGNAIDTRGTLNTQIHTSTAINARAAGFSNTIEAAFPGTGTYSVFCTDCLATGNDGTGWVVTSHTTWGWTDGTSFGNVTAYNPSSHANYNSPDTPATTDPGLASCYLWAPDGSAAQTGGWGATILYRYVNGTLTTTPLWDPTTGEFPHGAIIAGVNDTASTSAYNVHERLHVGTANGCAFPASFSGSTPPANPATYTNFDATAGGTLGNVTIAVGMDFFGVCVGLIDSAFNVGSVTSITQGGEALTLVSTQPSFTNFRRAAFGYKLAPTAGVDRSVVVNTTGAVTGLLAVAMQHDDVAAVNTAATSSGNGVDISTTGITATGEVVTDCLATGKTYNISAGADQTVQRSDDHTTQLLRLTTSTQAGANGGVMSYTNAGTTNWSQIVAALCPAACAGAGTQVITQVAGRVDNAFMTNCPLNCTVVNLGAVNAANVNVPVGTSIAVSLQADCTVADCAQAGRKLYFSRNSGAYVPMLNTVTTGISFHGTTADPTVVSGAVSTNLSDALTNIPGTTIQSEATIPVANMSLDSSLVNRWVLKLASDASGTFEFREYTDAGIELNGTYGATADAKITVTGTTPDISAPTGLKLVSSSNALVSLIWTPSTYATLAGYKVYQSTESGVYGDAVATITPTEAEATNTTPTQWSTQTLIGDTYYFVVTAFDSNNNESAVSNEVTAVQAGMTARSASTSGAAVARDTTIPRNPRCLTNCASE